MAKGSWDSTLDMSLDPNDIEFISFWLQKTRTPLKKAMEGFGVEQRLLPFRKSEFDLRPDGFEVKTKYRMSACGDLMFAKHIEASKDRLYDPVADLIFGADCAYANLESTLTSEAPKDFVVEKQGDTPYINITPNQYEALVKHKQNQYDIVQLANNHILDCGEEGISTTIEQLKKDHIDFIGVYESEADSKSIKYTMMGDVKIGWVGHTYSVNFKPIPEDKPWICDTTPFHLEKKPDISRIEKQIKQAKEEGCDLVLLTLHWGLEHEFYPHPDQLAWASRFAELGVDAIIGHHPHVIQAIEILHPENDPGNSVPVIYSLGNLTPAYGSPATVLSMIANFTISKGFLNGVAQTKITNLKLTPVAFMGEREGNQKYASIVPLDVLNRTGLDGETREYVEEINEYADIVFGDTWNLRGGGII